eukprot:56991_1
MYFKCSYSKIAVATIVYALWICLDINILFTSQIHNLSNRQWDSISSFEQSKCGSFKNYSVALVSRTYAGDYHRMKKWLLPTYQMFVDFNCIEIVFVFDNTSDDHTIGESIREKYGYKIYYEPLPENHTHILNKHIFPSLKWYAHLGYDRQLWATFWLDNYTDADIVGVIDSDAQIYSFITLNTILDASNKIKTQSNAGDHYKGDARILQFEDFTYYDFMFPDRFPQWFWRDTFEHTRQYLMKKYNQRTFDEAYSVFSTPGYSQFNILYQYSMKFEHDRYSNVPCHLHDISMGMVSVACNRCREEDILRGCCYNFGDVVSDKCLGLHPSKYEFLWRYTNCKNIWTNTIEMVQEYTQSLFDKFAEMDEDEIELKKQHCISYLQDN